MAAIPLFTDAGLARAAVERELYGPLPSLTRFPVRDRMSLGDGLELAVLDLPHGGQADAFTVRPSRPPRAHVFGLSFDGSHSLSFDPRVPVSRGWAGPHRTGRSDGSPSEEDRGMRAGAFPWERLQREGCAFTTVHMSDLCIDDPVLSESVRSFYGGETGAIGLWGWGLACLAETLSEGPVVFAGHSRLGKAALCARIVFGRAHAVIPIQAGTGGPAPLRKGVGETLEQMVNAFPHWLSPRLKSVDDLTFETHWLLGLCAPAHLLLLGAEDDQWADPHGAGEMLKLAAGRFPEGAVLRSSIRPGGHEVLPEDWDVILEFLGETLGP